MSPVLVESGYGSNAVVVVVVVAADCVFLDYIFYDDIDGLAVGTNSKMMAQNPVTLVTKALLH